MYSLGTVPPTTALAIRTFVPTTTSVPSFGSDAVTVSALTFDWISCTSGTSPACFNAAIASADLSPFNVGIVTFGLPLDTKIVTFEPFGWRVPAVGSWS